MTTVNSSHHEEPLPSVGWQAPLVDLSLTIIKRKVLILLVMILVGIIGFIKYLKTPTTYRTSAVAILLSREKPVFDVSVDVGTLETSEDSARRSSTGTLMLPADPDLYRTILTSRPVLESLARRFEKDLVKSMTGTVRSEELIASIRSMIKLDASETGIVTVTVLATDPDLSAAIANAVIEEGELASKAIERKLVMQQAAYIQQERIAAQSILDKEMARLKQFSSQNSVVDPRLQVSNRIREIRELSQEKVKLQRELLIRRTSYQDTDTRIKQLLGEIALCDKQIEDLEAKIVGDAGVKESGPLMVDYEALVEKVNQHRDMVVSLAAREEVFNIRAEQPAGNMAVIRSATPPDRPAGPSKKLYAIVSLLAGLFLGVGVAIVSEQWRIANQDPYIRKRVHLIAQQLKHLLGSKP